MRLIRSALLLALLLYMSCLGVKGDGSSEEKDPNPAGDVEPKPDPVVKDPKDEADQAIIDAGKAKGVAEAAIKVAEAANTNAVMLIDEANEADTAADNAKIVAGAAEVKANGALPIATAALAKAELVKVVSAQADVTEA
eukprot:Tbor_TRINITY_DN6319_c0_g1::TRINITY_DN6319_c0_g1_i1::g.17858::m.17858